VTQATLFDQEAGVAAGEPETEGLLQEAPAGPAEGEPDEPRSE
jgi:hypothetical protein